MTRASDTILGGAISKPVTLHHKNQTRDVKATFVSGSNPVAGVKVDFCLWGAQQTSGTDGTVSWSAIPDGEHSFRWIASGLTPAYEDGARNATVSATESDFTIQLTKNGDTTAAVIPNPTVPGDKTSPEDRAVSLGSVVLPDVDREEVNLSRSAYLGYFTSAQTKMYIGNLFIDEMVSIEWSIQENSVPVFGYNSRFADAYAQGRSLIQGQIMLNYTAPWYLGVALQNHFDRSPDGLLAADPNVKQLAYLLAQGKLPVNPAAFTPEQLALAKALSDAEDSAQHGACGLQKPGV